MSKYLKLFETTAQYNAYTADTSNFILPNVSVCKDAPTTVHYHPYVPPTYETVDLGLPSGILWARYNIGATSETDFGNYYQYGKGADDYFVTSGQSDYSRSENPLAASADTATQTLGGNWHMPTKAQCEELTANTTYEWITNFNDSGVNGGKFTAQNGNYIFIPAAGYYQDGVYNNLSNGGNVRTSSPYDKISAYTMKFFNGYVGMDFFSREKGYTIRPVMDA